MATERQVSRSAPTPAAATVPQQGTFSALSSLTVYSHKEAVDYLTILPLILLLSLVPLHADHLLQLRELKTSERLGEDVRELPTSFDEHDDDLPFIDTVPKEVELHVDVLAPVMETQILRKGRWWAGCPPSVQVDQLPHWSARPAAGAATQLGMPLWPLLRTLPRT